MPSLVVFFDLYVKKSEGKFSQVDLVIATKQGIVVVEAKLKWLDLRKC